MTLSQLECFVEAARTGNFSVAAANLFRSQQNVSRQIKLLEEELGTRLFERHKYGVSLTEEGKLFYDVEKEIIKQHRTVVDLIKDRRIPDSSRVRIGIGNFFGISEQYKISHMITEFGLEYPDLDVELDAYTAGELVGLLANGTIDIAVTYVSELEKAKDIKIRNIEHFVGTPGIVLSNTYSDTIKKEPDFSDLSGEIWGTMSKEASIDHHKRLEETLRKEYPDRKPQIRKYSSKRNLQLALVNGKCVTISFEDILNGFEDKLVFYPLPDLAFPVSVCLAWTNDRFSTKAKNLAEFFDKKKEL